MRERVCKLSLFSLILACVSTVPVEAAVKTKNSNRSYADAYQQVNTLRAQQEYVNAAAATLPVMVTDEKLANSIANSEAGAPSISDLEACSMIYPNGNFKWGVPEYGLQHEPQCIAVVELLDVKTNAVLATTTVAAGQSIKCNIDSFPGTSYNMSALSKTMLPADAAPTMDDVIAVMNEEQKQNAGLKIAAGAIIAGVAGNLLAPKDAGTQNNKIPLGTGKTQLIDTAVGAAAGAGIMAASTYSGKVAGDTIKSTAVNAASGMIIGNMMAGANSGDEVVATTKCSIAEGAGKGEYDCVVGNIRTSTTEPLKSQDDKDFYIISRNGRIVRHCKEYDQSGNFTCIIQAKTVYRVQLDNDKILDDIKNKDTEFGNINARFDLVEGNKFSRIDNPVQNSGENTYYKIISAIELEKPERAYALFANGSFKKPLGYKMSDWDNVKQTLNDMKPLGIYLRNNDGSVGAQKDNSESEKNEQIVFIPSSRDAEDGGLIDLSNQARAKGTIVGTAAGGALGGFAGYQGAKTEVSERWTSSLREYEDSLSNFMCVTGNRPLSKYNDYADIPALKSTEQ